MQATTSSGKSTSQRKPGKAAIIVLQVMSGMLCGTAVLTLLGIAVVDIFIVPKFAVIFSDFDTQMPRLTELLVNTPSVLVAITALLLSALLVIKEIIVRNMAIKLGINLLMFLAATAGVVLLVTGVFMSLVELMQSVM